MPFRVHDDALPLLLLSVWQFLLPETNPNDKTTEYDKSNIKHHYDVGNDFYLKFLHLKKLFNICYMSPAIKR